MGVVSRRMVRSAGPRKDVVTPPSPDYAALLAKVSGGVAVLPQNGAYQKPSSGVPVYVLSPGVTDTTTLPADWEWAISDQEWLSNSALGSVITLAGPTWTEIDAGGNESAGLEPVQQNGEILHVVQNPVTYGRSETCWYDGVDGTNYRPVSGHRLRISLDFKGSYIESLTDASSSSWFCPHQYLGRSLNGYWPHAPLSLMIEKGVVKLKGQPGSVNLYGTTTYDYEDDTWYRYEEDILLGGTSTGTISAWLNGRPMCLDYKPMLNATTPGYGTFYEGTGDQSRDLSFVYIKSGLYCGRDETLVNGDSKIWTRNRRWTWTTGSGVKTLREDSSLATGTDRLHWRNSKTAIISPVSDL